MNSHHDPVIDGLGFPHVGQVVGVEGVNVTVRLNHVSRREAVRTPQGACDGLTCNTLLRVLGPSSSTFGQVRRVWMEGDDGGLLQGMARLELFGEHDPSDDSRTRTLHRGVKRFPTVGAAVICVTSADLDLMYGRPSDDCAVIGQVVAAGGHDAHVMVDRLLSGHFAVLGMTGSGKSCAVCVVLQAVLGSRRRGRAVVLDPHSEYAGAFGKQAEVMPVDTLRLPFWLMNFEEAAATFVSGAGPEREAEIRILGRAIVEARRAYASAHGRSIRVTVDSPTPYYLRDFRKEIADGLGRLEQPDGVGPFQRLLNRIDALSGDSRFRFMFPEGVVTDEALDVISRVLGLAREGCPVTVVDISGAPGDVVDVVVSLLSRLLFEYGAHGDRAATPLLLVCEEAHRYLPSEEVAEHGPSRSSLLQIAREGRKHGVTLCVVSQRPADLSEGVLAQCNTLFALRMTNMRDQEFVARAAPDAALGVLDLLPALRNQEAVVVGHCVNFPTLVRFTELEDVKVPRAPNHATWDDWRSHSRVR